jgi:HlyD family secretion protein
VFVVRGGTATFVPVKVGIAGEEHFEVLSGVQAGDTVVAGPYQVIRDLKDSTRVRQQKQGEGPAAGGSQ